MIEEDGKCQEKKGSRTLPKAETLSAAVQGRSAAGG